METLKRTPIDWGVASQALEREGTSGDGYVTRAFPGGFLVGVVDGLGHGEEAAAAAGAGLDTLSRHANEPVNVQFQRCHERLRGTRGAAMSVARFDLSHGLMTWLGVGNVEGVLLRADPDAQPRSESLLLRGGVVGGHLPPLTESVTHVEPGDTLIFFTDGIDRGFIPSVRKGETPREAAARLLAGHARGDDDALVLVARYVGGEA